MSPSRTILFASLAWGCARSATDDTGRSMGEVDTHETRANTGSPERTVGVFRLGTPAPVTGLYGIAADENSGTVFVSNLHAPWLTLVDTESGEFSGAIDLRDYGIEVPWLPQLALVDGVLWLSAFNSSRLLGLDPNSHEPIADLYTTRTPVDWFVAEDGLWILTEQGADRVTASGFGDRLNTPTTADRLAITPTHVAWLDIDGRTVGLLSRDGETLWSLDVSETSLNDIAIIGERVFLTDRITGAVIALEEGQEVGRFITGSDTFNVTVADDALLVTNRQGAALPPSGAYEVAPGLVTRLTADLERTWQVEAGKTIHFLAWDGQQWWTANEDSMDLTAFSPDGDVNQHTPKLGLTLDHVAQVGDDLFFGSHLTDEVWGEQSATSCTSCTATPASCRWNHSWPRGRCCRPPCPRHW